MAVTLIVFVTGMASGGMTMETPACGIAIVPPRRPIFLETVIDVASGTSRCTGLMIVGEPRRVVTRSADEASGATLGADAEVGAVLSVAPQAARVTETATAATRAARERTRMEEVLKG